MPSKIFETQFTKDANIEFPIICGAMYPCSNPELVAAASEAGGIGIIQPISMVYVHDYEFRDGIRYMKSLTDKPLGMNIIVEKSVKAYTERMQRWTEIAIEEGVKFFITALGNPKWVVDLAHANGGVVYHDVTEKKWAEIAVDKGVDGLICVNNRAGGHAGTRSPEFLIDAMQDLGKPIVCAGGIGDGKGFAEALKLGYAGVQMGTRFIATKECRVHSDYQDAILRAREDDIVLTDKISGVPVSVIKTPYIENMGLNSGPIARYLLKNRRTKHWMRTLYSLKSIWQLKKASLNGHGYKDFWQAGKSVEEIDKVDTVDDVFKSFIKEAEPIMKAKKPKAKVKATA